MAHDSHRQLYTWYSRITWNSYLVWHQDCVSSLTSEHGGMSFVWISSRFSWPLVWCDLHVNGANDWTNWALFSPVSGCHLVFGSQWFQFSYEVWLSPGYVAAYCIVYLFGQVCKCNECMSLFFCIRYTWNILLWAAKFSSFCCKI